MRRAPAVLIVSVLAAGLSGCSGAGGGTASGPPSGAAGSSAPSPVPSSGAGTQDIAENVTMPGRVRHQLVVAAAAKKHVPAGDYAGLDPHTRHYAYDDTTQTYWAGASLVPRGSSTAAGVSVQDAGSYDLFERPKGGRWRVWEVGAAGNSSCPVHVPNAVAVRWGWPDSTCRPPRPS